MRYWFCLVGAIALVGCSPTTDIPSAPTPADPTSEALTESNEQTEADADDKSEQPVEADSGNGFAESDAVEGLQVGESTVQSMVENLGYVCGTSTEIDYQTQTIESPDGNFRAYAGAQLIKEVDAEMASRKTDDGYCFSSERVTKDQTVVIDQRGQRQQATVDDYEGAYVIVNPVAISPDSRYLVSQVKIEYVGNQVNRYVMFHDLVAGQQIETSNMCSGPELELVEFVGFTGDSEALVNCNGYGNDTGIYETVELTSAAVTPLSDEPDSYTSESGSTVGMFKITGVKSRN